MRLLIFMVLSRYKLACKYGIIFEVSVYGELYMYVIVIVFSDIWHNNFQSGKAKTNLIQFTF